MRDRETDRKEEMFHLEWCPKGRNENLPLQKKKCVLFFLPLKSFPQEPTIGKTDPSFISKQFFRRASFFIVQVDTSSRNKVHNGAKAAHKADISKPNRHIGFSSAKDVVTVCG